MAEPALAEPEVPPDWAGLLEQEASKDRDITRDRAAVNSFFISKTSFYFQAIYFVVYVRGRADILLARAIVSVPYTLLLSSKSKNPDKLLHSLSGQIKHLRCHPA